MILPNELQMEYGGSFLHIASELEDVGWFSFSIRAVSVLSQHHCNVCHHFYIPP